ncbi:glycosyltransferase [Turicibacter sanguinis]|uniref:glycosyltransferase n=1 Tax=Turicibacter sanguinis TaxID=154288 RepID=UPI0006C6355D|nr:glycosyltransferase [Turicibacter sanguinis]MDB8576361.1 glycosyltransferase [Turicibacter sanguinis]MDB8579309.1 glycosyltransferase [Turicibacter sanguinis]MDB8585052.1 glycosyltransferase [Turicibacter sanguinis]MDB8588081.1 glycosyltransferase [Turicibacter sanguinis]MDB8598811.1 glycosyltransferase [Turicibacter sanguinis]
MKKILIVSYFFSPANMMGAVRGTKLSKYLSRIGYDVTVICSKNNKLEFMPGEMKKDKTLENDIIGINVVRVGHTHFYLKLANVLRKISTRLFPRGTVQERPREKDSYVNKKRYIVFIKKLAQDIVHFLTFMVTIVQDLDFCLNTKNIFREYDIDINEYHAVISTYGPLGSHFVGKMIKKMNPKIIWVADFRDPITLGSDGIIQRKIKNIIQQNICNNSDKITAISQGNLEMITNGKYNEKKMVIMNGYDIEDIILDNRQLKKNKLEFVYTGTTYAGKRDLSPIFKVISELIKEKIIDKDYIIFNYAGSEDQYVYRQAARYNLEDIIKSSGYISRTEAIELQANSEILVVSTWNEMEHSGVIPGKFLEYMAYKKNIISLVNGEVKNSEIREIINNYKLGITYEQANKEKDYKELKEYISKQYNWFIKNGHCNYEGKKNLIELHDYRKIAEKFNSLILDNNITIDNERGE